MSIAISAAKIHPVTHKRKIARVYFPRKSRFSAVLTVGFTIN